ncbi:unnamed protein product [Chondrus crispus]|uniref:Uncharacterized protein n=1 Tax=Chondrus crispus TaxID=2769 RepID=R7QRV8_CHOCR|nr:unnamed protein product [Chondrus crispus]CDF40874.1 unnamed protein product [Chondrus crispus]|eukprot:XP_005711168.1 unnamed protein product [Chondrus crispus]
MLPRAPPSYSSLSNSNRIRRRSAELQRSAVVLEAACSLTSCLHTSAHLQPRNEKSLKGDPTTVSLTFLPFALSQYWFHHGVPSPEDHDSAHQPHFPLLAKSHSSGDMAI